jgi:hypothetical protein
MKPDTNHTTEEESMNRVDSKIHRALDYLATARKRSVAKDAILEKYNLSCAADDLRRALSLIEKDLDRVRPKADHQVKQMGRDI